MSKAQQRRYFNSAGEHQKAILGILQAIGRSRGLDRVWSDWIEVSAIALAKLDLRQADAREDRYRQIMGQYEKDEAQQLAHAFAHLVMAFEKSQTEGEFGDLLGSTFMMLDMGSSHNGQFFTPYEISMMMGMMLMGEGQELVQKVGERGFVRLLEPACGAGGMVIAAAQSLHQAGVPYQQSMHAVAIDIDRRCAHMTFFPSHSFEQYYQGVRRCWRFGQKRPVTVDLITTEGELGVLKNLQRKAQAADEMFERLVGLMNNALRIERQTAATIPLEAPAWL